MRFWNIGGGVSAHSELSDVTTPHVAADLATNSVESAEIKDLAVSAAKIAAAAILPSKIGFGIFEEFYEDTLTAQYNTGASGAGSVAIDTVTAPRFLKIYSETGVSARAEHKAETTLGATAKTMEWKMKVSANPGANKCPVGLANEIQFGGTDHVKVDFTSTTAINLMTNAAGTPSNDTGTIADCTADYRVYKLVMTTASVKLYQDDVLIAEVTTNIPTATMHIGTFNSTEQNGDISIDYWWFA